MVDMVAQVAVLVFGVTAVVVVGLKGPLRKWGYVIGLFSQPFWFYTFWHNEQYVMLAVAAFYTAAWLNGIWNNFHRGSV